MLGEPTPAACILDQGSDSQPASHARLPAMNVPRWTVAVLVLLAVLGVGCGSSTPGAPALQSLSLSPASVQGGAGATGTLTLTGAAPAGGAVVALTSNLASVTVPATATVPEGETAAAFPVATVVISTDETAVIAAVHAGVTRTATLTVSPTPCVLRTPGAQWLAFSSRRTGVYDVYAMRADGTCLTQVTNDAADDLFATWSPAGSIAYMSARSGRMQVYVRDFTSGDERLLDTGDLAATSSGGCPTAWRRFAWSRARI